jgi:hypothetical protein
MQKIGLIFGILMILSCNPRTTNKSIDYKDFLKNNGIEIIDFKYSNTSDFSDFDYEAKGFKELKDTMLISKWFGKNYNLAFNIYLYSIQNPVGNILPLTFIQTGSDYGAIVLKLIDYKNDIVIRTFELSGGECGGPGEIENNKWELCERNSSLFLSDSVIRNTKVRFYCDSLSDESNMRVDTIKSLLTINQRTGLKSRQTDSIRIITKVRNYVR